MIIDIALLSFGALAIILQVYVIIWAYQYRRSYAKGRYMTPESIAQASKAKLNVYVPCKGKDDDLYDNLKSVLTQDYPGGYHVVFITESNSDSAVDVIKPLQDEFPGKAFHVVAGLASKCGQKNHNLVKGVEAHPDVDYYVFCDADNTPSKHWLRNLISPFSNDQINITSSYHTLETVNKSFVHRIFVMFVSYLAAANSHPALGGLWGGSTAIRRSLYDGLKVKELWSSTVVDDVSLSKVILKHKEAKRHYVPIIDIRTMDISTDWKRFSAWFVRQILFQKIYIFGSFLFGLFLQSIVMLFILGFFVFGGLFLSGFSHFDIYALACGVFTISMSAAIALTKHFFAKKERFIEWFLMAPVVLAVIYFLLWRTALTTRLIWRDKVYIMNKTGGVTGIEYIKE